MQLPASGSAVGRQVPLSGFSGCGMAMRMCCASHSVQGRPWWLYKGEKGSVMEPLSELGWCGVPRRKYPSISFQVREVCKG